MTMHSGNGHKKEPIEGHDKCPDCGSEERLIGAYVAELKELGILSEESFPQASGVLEVPFMELKKLSLIQTPQSIRMIPVLRILFDVCKECKRPYVRRVEYGEKGVIQQQAVPQQVNKI